MTPRQTREMEIPFVDLKRQYREMKPAIDNAISRVLRHGQFILGPEVEELETRLAEFTGAKHCVTVSSGTDALLIALMAVGVGPGDEVITTPFTFIATAEVIVLVGAKPVFVDVDPTTCNLDAGKLAAVVTSRTRAIMPVSLYGQPADMDEINAIAGRDGIPVIEDAAQSFGAEYRGRRSCNLSDIGATSFFPSKPLGCYGDGGALFTNDDALAKAMREIRVHGQDGRYHHTRIGVAGRMDTLQCAIVLAKLEGFRRELELRSAVAERYTRLLLDHRDDVEVVQVKNDRTSVYAQYAVLVSARERVVDLLKGKGVPTAVHYPRPVHRQPAYAKWRGDSDFPVSDDLSARVLNLPMHPYLEPETQEYVVDQLVSAVASI
jgi:UDP-2-acetamido-2-deoxy-ribo-hexuluronate aminotransferase